MITVDLPEELKTVSKPKFKIDNDTLTIYNRPFWDDWIFEIAMIFGAIFFAHKDDILFGGDYAILFVGLSLYGLSFFSLNKITFNFKQQTVEIKNYNPLVNLYRKLFQMPFEIKFNEIEKVYSDWESGGRSTTKYLTVLQTNALYKFKIAMFERESQSIIFTAYLGKIIKTHKVHSAQVSDTTVLN